MYLPAGHKVGIYIDRIYRVGYADDVVIGEYVSDVACVALGTVVHEYLGDVYAQPPVVIRNYGLA